MKGNEKSAEGNDGESEKTANSSVIRSIMR